MKSKSSTAAPDTGLRLDQQACSNCYFYRPHKDKNHGQCRHELPIRWVHPKDGPKSAFPPVTPDCWCAKWKKHPDGVAADYRAEASTELIPTPTPLPAPMVVTENPTAVPSLTRNSGPMPARGKHEKWHKEPPPNAENAPEELRAQ